MKKISILSIIMLFVATMFAQEIIPNQEFRSAGPVIMGNKAPMQKVTYNKDGKGSFWFILPEAIGAYWGTDLQGGSFPSLADTLNYFPWTSTPQENRWYVNLNAFGQVYNWPAVSWNNLYDGQPLYDDQSIPLVGESTYTIDSVTVAFYYARGTQVPDSVVDTLLITYVVNLESEGYFTYGSQEDPRFATYLFPYNLFTFRPVKTFTGEKASRCNLSKDAVFYYDTIYLTPKDVTGDQFVYRTYPSPAVLQNITSKVVAVTGNVIPGIPMAERKASDTIGVQLNDFRMLAFGEVRTEYLSYGSEELLTDLNTGIYVGSYSWYNNTSMYGSFMPNEYWSSKPKFAMGVHVVCEDCPIVNIEDPEEQTINVYPNPASSNLKVNFEGEANVQLFNMVGQMVYSTTATDNAIINVSNLRSGVYMLKVNDKTTKVVVR